MADFGYSRAKCLPYYCPYSFLETRAENNPKSLLSMRTKSVTKTKEVRPTNKNKPTKHQQTLLSLPPTHWHSKETARKCSGSIFFITVHGWRKTEWGANANPRISLSSHTLPLYPSLDVYRLFFLSVIAQSRPWLVFVAQVTEIKGKLNQIME